MKLLNSDGQNHSEGRCSNNGRSPAADSNNKETSTLAAMDIFLNHSESHLNSISRQLDELYFPLEIENENLKMSKGRLEGCHF